MATYWRGFDDADGISDWTEIAVASGQTAPSWSIVSTDQVQATSASSHNEALTWNDIDGDADRDDVEILFQAYVDSTTVAQRAAAIRISTSGASRTGYYVTARSNGFGIGRFTGSTFTSITSNTNTRTSGAWYWVRFRVNQTGNTLQARIWADGDSEPGTWDLDTTDSTYVYAGHVGFLKAPNTSTQLWRKFGVGTNGDTAPASAPSSGVTVSVPAGSLSLTGYAPTVTATANQTVSVPAGSLTLTGYAPDVQVTATGTTVQVPAASLSLTGYAPDVVAPQNVTVPAASLTLTALQPTVRVGADQVVAVPLSELTLTGFAPVVATTSIVSVPAGSLTLTGYAPTVTNGEEVAPAPMVGAGRPRRQRQRVVVEIDGEDFIAESVEEARALLDKAKDAAEEKASIAVKRATEAKKRPARKIVADARKSLAPPTINAPGIEDYAGQIAQQIEDLYRSTIRTIEVESLLRNRDRAEEDDEDILLLIA